MEDNMNPNSGNDDQNQDGADQGAVAGGESDDEGNAPAGDEQAAA